jgi:hypothetical protein
VTAGFTGNLEVGVSGLAEGEEETASLAAMPSRRRPCTVPAGTRLARFDVDAANDAGDFDLYVYAVDAQGRPGRAGRAPRPPGPPTSGSTCSTRRPART